MRCTQHTPTPDSTECATPTNWSPSNKGPHGKAQPRRRQRLTFATHSPTSNGVNIQSGEAVAVENGQKVQRRRRREVEDKRNPPASPLNPYSQVAIHSSDREVDKYRDELEKEARPKWEQEVVSEEIILFILQPGFFKQRYATQYTLPFNGSSSLSVQGDLRGRLKHRRLRSVSKSPKRTSIFSMIQRDRSALLRRMHRDKRIREGDVFHKLRVEEEVCPHTQKAATKILVYGEQSRSQKVKIVEGDIGNQSRKNRSQVSKRKIHLNHEHARKQIPSPLESATLNYQKRAECQTTSKHMTKVMIRKITSKIFQAVAKVERWAMPTWCHMFNSTLTGSARVWFDDLPPKSIDSYDDLKKVFLANYLQQKKCVKDPVEIHHIKKREGESMEDFLQRFKAESRHVKGATKFMRIFGFMYEITNPELIKRLHDNIINSVDEMMRITTTFLRGEVAASNQASSGSKKPNDSSYRTPHWLQWRNHMANGTNIASSENRRCRAFHLYNDELCVPRGILTLRSSRIIPRECTTVSEPEAQPSGVIQATEERIKMAIHLEHPEQTVSIGSTLTKEGRKALYELLRRSLDVFAWKPADMTGVPRHIAKHRLNVPERCSPVRQNKRSQTPERNKAIQKEVEKLVDAGIMKEVHYHSWLSNPFMVKKHDDSWRMCVDFKDLNKACPKDDFPDTPMEVDEEFSDPWTLFMDGSSCVDGFGVGLILTDSEGGEFTYALRFRFEATNNDAE
nr:reverse transcriptase domain-containing protein [Tanacetum cinerariifolium]